MTFDRTFADASYDPVSQRAELSYAGVGASIGTVHRLWDRSFCGSLMPASCSRGG